MTVKEWVKHLVLVRNDKSRLEEDLDFLTQPQQGWLIQTIWIYSDGFFAYLTRKAKPVSESIR